MKERLLTRGRETKQLAVSEYYGLVNPSYIVTSCFSLPSSECIFKAPHLLYSDTAAGAGVNYQ
jgi:hypothetical protein